MIQRIGILILFVSTWISCGGYDRSNDPLAPDEVQMANLATQLKDQALALQPSVPESLRESYGTFVESTARFQNLSLRFSSNSLEARKAFDRVMFYESQISQSETVPSSTEFQSKWNELRGGLLREIAEKLGYRPEKLKD